jgi:hypothetical protein
VGANDESFGCGAHEIEGVACHKGEEVVRGWRQHCDVAGPYHLGRVHAIAVGPLQSRQDDFVVPMNVAQSAKEGVAMRRQPDISLLTWKRRTGYVPYRDTQGFSVNAFHNHCCHSDGTDLDAPDWRASQDLDVRTLAACVLRLLFESAMEIVWLGVAQGRFSRILQGKFKLPALMCLRVRSVDQNYSAVSECRDAYNKKA